MSKFNTMNIPDPVINVRPYLKNRNSVSQLCCSVCTEEKPAGDYRYGRRICQVCYNKRQNDNRKEKTIMAKYSQNPEAYIEALNYKIHVINQLVSAPVLSH